MYNLVAILILLELTLQFDAAINSIGVEKGRNPYFIGINSAMQIVVLVLRKLCCRNPYFIGINSAMEPDRIEIIKPIKSQSLFYWN